MGKGIAIGQAILIVKQFFDENSDLFEKVVPNNFYEVMDKLLFLSCDTLKISNNGTFLDGSQKIAIAIGNLSNFVIWGILLIYGFKMLFGYLISKNIVVPWKFFIRIIIFGILANSATFICYTGMFFVENTTEYIRSYSNKDNISFEILDEYILKDELEESTNNIYTFEAIMTLFIYFATIFLAICLGIRYILIKIFMLLSPVFLIFAGFEISEKIFYIWIKKFLKLLSFQIIFSIALGIVNLCEINNKIFMSILVCSMLFLGIKNICNFLKLSY